MRVSGILLLLVTLGAAAACTGPRNYDSGVPTDASTPPQCGDGVLSTGEDCDDGNNTPGDGCAPDCRAVCGDGFVQGSETCDDGNDVTGDGCTECRAPGELVWRAEGACVGRLLPGNDGTIINLCRNDDQALLNRFSADGELLEQWPRGLIEDPVEIEVSASAASEASDGSLTVVMGVRRTESGFDESGRRRIRVARFAPDQTRVWSTDVNPYPPRAPYYPWEISVNSSGTVAVAALRGGASSSANRAYAAVVSNDGTVAWEYTASGISTGTAVLIDESGAVYLGGSYEYDLGSFVEPLIVGISPDGTGVFQHVLDELPFDTGGGGVIRGVLPSVSGSGVQILGVAVTETAPHVSTAAAWLRDVAPDGTYSDQNVLWSADHDVANWDEAVDLVPEFGFATHSARAVYAWGGWGSGSGAFGIENAGEVAWTVSRTEDDPTVLGAHQFGDLICFLEFLGRTSELACYATQ